MESNKVTHFMVFHLYDKIIKLDVQACHEIQILNTFYLIVKKWRYKLNAGVPTALTVYI